MKFFSIVTQTIVVLVIGFWMKSNQINAAEEIVAAGKEKLVEQYQSGTGQKPIYESKEVATSEALREFQKCQDIANRGFLTRSFFRIFNIIVSILIGLILGNISYYGVLFLTAPLEHLFDSPFQSFCRFVIVPIGSTGSVAFLLFAMLLG